MMIIYLILIVILDDKIILFDKSKMINDDNLIRVIMF